MKKISHFNPLPLDTLKVSLTDAKGAERVPTEHEEQRAFVSWFRRSGDVLIFAIPNGGFRGKAQAIKLKAEGVSAGVPDLFIPAWGLWIEMKRREGGSLSAEQKDWIAYLEACGYSVLTPKGAHAACDAVIEWLQNNHKTLQHLPA